ncbi:uncharacterized protein TNIN_153441 [Trichonephila inaurata madagascariensis]|uniref:Gustatory receptor n=1 Tax=Trichonephila inaurata madagascariensis TaxID=2747483 RepID=A0A8X6XAA3_9ARAC|nr:uncharacterized protein TNIN_153441 [Trichonephila inaurata madagascariensis]
MYETIDDYKAYYSFRIDFEENGTNVFVVRTVFLVLSFAILFAFPSCISILCCAVFHQISEALSAFSEDISNCHKRISSLSESIKLMKNHHLFYRLIRNLEQVFSTIAFLLLCSQTLSMYIALSTYFATDAKAFTASLQWQSVPAMTVVPVCLISMAVYASKISKEIETMQGNLQDIYNSSVRDLESNRKSLQIVRAMLNTKFPCLTAGSVFELKLGLILSVFGSLFTYGLLVINIKT